MHILKNNKKGNITIFVLFVLIVSGIIGIISVHFIKQMLYYKGSITNYYKSYYIARAGLEMALTQTSNRGIGFEYNISDTDSIVIDNFICPGECILSTSIKSKNHILNKKFRETEICDNNTSFLLLDGESLVLPLFLDHYTQENNIYSTFVNDQETQKIIKRGIPTKIMLNFINLQENPITNSNITLSFVTDNYLTFSKSYTGNEISSSFIEDKFLSQTFLDNLPEDVRPTDQSRIDKDNYLIISNTSQNNSNINFCIYYNNLLPNITQIELPGQVSYIQSIGTYNNQSIGLKAIYKHNILPGFLSHTSLDFE